MAATWSTAAVVVVVGATDVVATTVVVAGAVVVVVAATVVGGGVVVGASVVVVAARSAPLPQAERRNRPLMAAVRIRVVRMPAKVCSLHHSRERAQRDLESDQTWPFRVRSSAMMVA
jgi:hypothetical protein